MDQRAIDVEKKQTLLHIGHVERSRDISYCSSGNVQLSAAVPLTMRNSSTALRSVRNEGLETGRVHHEYRDHATEKDEQGNRRAGENCSANWVLLTLLTWEGRCVGEIGRYCA